MAEQEQKPTYPYISFRTVLNLLQRFEAEGGVPTRLDRGVLTGSEGSKTLLLAALKSLGLIGQKGETSLKLANLAMKPNERPQLIAELLKQHYPKQVQLGATLATQKELEETFEGMDGETRRKAVAFFLHAAEYAKIPTSKYFKTPRITMAIASAGRRRKRGTNGGGKETPSANHQSADEERRQRYIDLLMKRAESGDELDEKLLDRIEALLGYRKPE